MYTVPASGGSPRRILGRFSAFHPSWSPDGRALAWAPGFTAIWRSRRDGTQPRQLTRPVAVGDEFTIDLQPAWSPDGRWILFTRGTPRLDEDGEILGYSTALWRVRASGGGEQPVPAAGTDVEHPSWAPGGRRIAFNDTRGRMWIAAADGSGRRALGVARRGARPIWSPDGSRIAFVDTGTGRHRGQLTVYDLGSRSLRRVAALNLAPDETGNWPSTSYAWSTDGRWLAAARLRPTRCTPHCRRFEVVLVRVRDGHTRLLVTSPTSGDLAMGLAWH